VLAPIHALEHEQRGDRRHVAEIAQDRAALGESAALDLERVFQRIEHLRAARMAGELVDIAELEIVPLQECRENRAEVACDQQGNALRAARFETVFLHLPAHDVERLGPGVLSGGTQFGTVAFR